MLVLPWITPIRTLSLVLAACILGAGCASHYDRDLLDRRTRTLYPSGWEESEEEGTVPASALLEGPLELEECLRFGMEESAHLRAAFHEWIAKTERVVIDSTLPEPRLTYGEFLEEVQTRTGPQERRFGLRQAFPWPGTLRRRAAVANREAEAAWHRVEGARLRVAAEIETAFLEYAFLGRELEITRQLLQLLRGLEPVVQGRIRSGSGQEDLLRLQVEIGRLEDDLASLERKRPMVSAQLAKAMQLERGGRDLPLPLLEQPEILGLSGEGHLYLSALESNPEILALQQISLARREAQDLAVLRRRPDFSVAVDYTQTGDALAPGTSGSGDDPILLGLTMSLPIWTSSYASSESEARHRAIAAREQISEAMVHLRAALEEEDFRVEDASRRISLYRQSLIPRANESLELTLNSYRSGEANVLDLIDSERALLEFQLSLWRACRDHAQGRARVRQLTGGTL